MFLLVDNYDSFTYNLYALFLEAGAEVKVIKNDEYEAADDYEGIILSPGPSHPKNSGSSLTYIKEYAGKKPIFGVCLGMQVIGDYLGFEVDRAKTIQHGKKDAMKKVRDGIIFQNIPDDFQAVRYHSLSVKIDNDHVTARAASDNEVMAIEYPNEMIFGVQFHPESIESRYGKEMIQNFLNFCRSI